MPTYSNRLGKGLDALIPLGASDSGVEEIPIADIVPNRFQPRKQFHPDRLNELADSIREHGLTQPIVVRKQGERYELVVGERRLEACKRNRHHTISAIVRDFSDQEACEVALVENMDRDNLNAIEIAQSFQRLMHEFGYTQQALSDRFSRSRSSVANMLRLLKLPASIQDHVQHQRLTEGHARALVEVHDNEAMCESFAQTIIKKKLSVRQAESLVKNRSHAPSTKASSSRSLFNAYEVALSKALNADITIRHKKNTLSLEVSHARFKDHIAFLDRLCSGGTVPSES